jgi:hypothetical protein
MYRQTLSLTPVIGWVKTITKTGAATAFDNEMRSTTGSLITNFGCHNLARASNGDIYAAGPCAGWCVIAIADRIAGCRS